MSRTFDEALALLKRKQVLFTRRLWAVRGSHQVFPIHFYLPKTPLLSMKIRKRRHSPEAGYGHVYTIWRI